MYTFCFLFLFLNFFFFKFAFFLQIHVTIFKQNSFKKQSFSVLTKGTNKLLLLKKKYILINFKLRDE